MTDQEIDKWVEEHVTAPENSDTRPAVVEWGKIVAHKFYNLGRTLTVEDIKAILDISFWNNDPQKILDEYNRICGTLKVTRR